MGGFHALGSFGDVLWRALLAPQLTYGLRLALAVIFAVAGVHKLRNPLVAAAAASDFGVLRRPVVAVGVAQGAAEAVLAIALTVPVAVIGVVASVCAAGTCAGFTFLTGRAVAAGRTFACNCLGPSAAPVSGATVARAVLMMLGAVIAAVGAPREAFTSTSAHDVLVSVGIGAACIGMPYTVWLAAQWNNLRRRLDAETDWRWVVAFHDGRAVS